MKKNRTVRFYKALTFVLAALMCLFLLSGCLDFDADSLFITRSNISESRNSNVVVNNNNVGISDFVNEYEHLLRMIEELFIGDFDLAQLHTEAMRALVSALDDEWSFYMTQEEAIAFRQRATNHYTGIGVEILINHEVGGVEVTRVFRGSPAEAGGILVGDVIVYIDGNSLAGLTIPEVRYLVARPIGYYADITVIRNETQRVELNVMYNVVMINPIDYELLYGNIGHVIIHNFDANSGERFIETVNELIEMGATSFIYDVRSNSGGSAREMTIMLDFLLPEGEIFVHINRLGEERITMSDEYWLDMPAVVLINRFSFSAAEYFAAMLSEFDYALVVGEPTTGKNRSQTTHAIPDGGALHISTGHYLTKNRVSLRDTGGFTPDYIIELCEDKLNLLFSGRLDIADDPQLQKAISLLKN